MGRTIWKCVWSHRWCEDIVLCGTDACWFQNWFEDRRGERKDWSDSLAVSTFAWHAAHCLQCARLDFGWRCAGRFASCWWLGGWWLVARHICYADACPQTGKSHSTGHDWPSGGSFTQRATCLSSRIDWQIGSQRCCHAGALAELACVWVLENLLTSHSAFGFNRLSAERWFELFGGLLTCLMPSVYPTDMFDREYPDMISHVSCRECICDPHHLWFEHVLLLQL